MSILDTLSYTDTKLMLNILGISDQQVREAIRTADAFGTPLVGRILYVPHPEVTIYGVPIIFTHNHDRATLVADKPPVTLSDRVEILL